MNEFCTVSSLFDTHKDFRASLNYFDSKVCMFGSTIALLACMYFYFTKTLSGSGSMLPTD